jgi:hypothetical protein
MTLRGFDTFSGLIRNGTFDRPAAATPAAELQVLVSAFDLTRMAIFCRECSL